MFANQHDHDNSFDDTRTTEIGEAEILMIRTWSRLSKSFLISRLTINKVNVTHPKHTHRHQLKGANLSIIEECNTALISEEGCTCFLLLGAEKTNGQDVKKSVKTSELHRSPPS